MSSFTPGRPGLSLGIGIGAIVLGIVLLPVALADAHGNHLLQIWWSVVPILAGLYFAILGAVALIRRR